VGVARDPVIRRLTLIPSGEDEAVRRYHLAALDEIALASPPYEPTENKRRPTPPDPADPAKPGPGPAD
jgi:hypothetical protein